MMKKLFLLVSLLVGFILTQHFASAQDQYTKAFLINSVQKKVELNWFLPYDNQGKSSVVSFTVLDDGTVTNLEILRSSGDKKFDASVISAIYQSVPFEAAQNLDSPVKIKFFFSSLFTTAEETGNVVSSNVLNVSNADPYINFSDYTETLQNKVNANWRPKADSKSREAIANVNIGKDGALNDFSIIKSSKNKKFDQEVLDSIARSVPMDAFPYGINASNTDVQLTYTLNKPQSKTDLETSKYEKYVQANVMNIKGYDKYTKLVERILADDFKNMRYFRNKDLIVEMKINKVGKLKYVKVVKSSGDENFDRDVIAVLSKNSFPPVPDTIPFDDVILNYEIVTQRGLTFKDYVVDYLLYGRTTGLKAFNLAKEQD